jgi:hypothetical protein
MPFTGKCHDCLSSGAVCRETAAPLVPKYHECLTSVLYMWERMQIVSQHCAPMQYNHFAAWLIYLSSTKAKQSLYRMVDLSL